MVAAIRARFLHWPVESHVVSFPDQWRVGFTMLGSRASQVPPVLVGRLAVLVVIEIVIVVLVVAGSCDPRTAVAVAVAGAAAAGEAARRLLGPVQVRVLRAGR